MPSTITDKVTDKVLHFEYLPAFAQYIIREKINEFTEQYLQLAREFKLPLLHYFKDFSEKELLAIAKERSIEYLQFLERNDAHGQISEWIRTWKLDKLPLIDKSDVVIEDITLLTHIRKKLFIQLLPDYTSDRGEMLSLINEIDTFMLATESIALKLFLDFQNEKVTEHATKLAKHEADLLEAQELAGMGSFEWDFVSHGISVTPQLRKILELDELGKMDAFMERIHPGDRAKVKQAISNAIEKNEIYEAEYRFVGKDKEKVIWSRGFIFHENGKRIMRGTVMDVTDRHYMVQKLMRSEELYKQAQALTHIGNYTWELKSGKFSWSDELYRIYGFEPIGRKVTYEQIQAATHPDDADRVQKITQDSLAEKKPFDYVYRIIRPPGDTRIVHARGDILLDDITGEVYKLIGTVADITEREHLFNELQRNRDLYKQAAKLAKMGNWTWDVANNKLEWTEELYELYELDPSTPVNYELFEEFTHPDDLEFVNKTVQESLKTLKLDYHFRIKTRNGKEKIIHSRATVQTNEAGEPMMFVGTAQDVTEKQNLLRQLEHRDELYKQAQALAHIGNWSFDVLTGAITWTDEVYRIYGLEPQSEVITYERYLGLLHPEDKSVVLHYVSRCIDYHESYDFSHRIISADNRLKILHSKGEVVVDKNGKPLQLRGTVQDVTEQKLIEQELREKQHFILKIADAAPSIIASYNINTGQYLFVSQGIEKLLGYDAKHAIEKGVAWFAELVHPDDLPRIAAENTKALEDANAQQPGEEEIIVEFKYRMRHANGDYRWFHTYGTVFDRNNENRVEHVLNISIDITESIESQQKILEQEQFISHIADASPTVLYLFDAINGSVLYINQEAESVIGYTPQEIIDMGGNVLFNLYHPDDYARIGERLRSYKDSTERSKLFQFEVRMKHKNGEWRWLLIREIVFKHTPDGRIQQILGACLDITNRKEMESALFRKTLELQQSNASLGEFAYVASHDLKEPLRKITTFGDLLTANYKDNLTGDGHLYLNKIIESSRRMQVLIDDLLSLSMISNEKSFEDHDINVILNEVIQSLDHKIEESHAVVSTTKLPVVNVVPSQIRQLFQNLLSNSLKYVKPGKTPEVRITHRILRPIEVATYSALARAAQYLRIDFIDNGIGFDQVFAEKIFTIFQRLHGRAEYEGTGIGLAICKKIVENHGGVIYAEGRSGEGATFTVILPMV